MKIENVLNDNIGYIQLLETFGTDQTIVNTARVSYLGESKGLQQDKKLLFYLWRNKHTSPFEAVIYRMKVHCPLFVARQWMRHRTQCLSGDTNITFNRPDRWKKGIHTVQSPHFKDGFTLKELYRKWENGGKDIIKNMLIRVFDETTRLYTVSHIKDIFYSGKKHIFKITTQKGKVLKCSKDHRILTSNGWNTLENAVGLTVTKNGTAAMSKDCFVLTNGETELYKSKDWLSKCKESGMCVSEMAEAAECSYNTIRKWLKIHNLKFNPLLNLTGTNGKPPWNKGLKGYKLDTVFSEEARKKISAARSGDKSNFWKGGITKDRHNIGRWTTSVAKKIHRDNDYKCVNCGSSKDLHCHHIKSVVEYPEEAYNIKNLTSLCKKCHIETHRNKEGARNKKGVPLAANYEKIVSIEYIGIEDTYDLEIEGVNKNFLANGVVVHNSFNEVSRRYTSEKLEFYIPTEWRTQDTKNKQTSGDIVVHSKYWSDLVTQKTDNAVALYHAMLGDGISREMARMILPTNLYTTFYTVVNLHNLLHFVTLRNSEHAQLEIRSYAHCILEKFIKERNPWTYEIYKLG